MPLLDHMQMISVDDHIVEHPCVWQDRLQGSHRENGPVLVELKQDLGTERFGRALQAGDEVWRYQGQYYGNWGLSTTAGRPPEEIGDDPTRFDQLRPGFYDPVRRAEDMDLDGIQAQLCFPQLPRFAGTLFLEGEDRSLALDCVRAYNDFVIDEWCGAAPGRFIPMVILPLWDPALAVEEIERTGKKGAKAIAFPENPVPLGLPSFHTDHWNPVFAAAQELDAPLCLHFGTSGSSPNPAPDAPGIVPMSLMGLNSMSTTADLIFSDVFHEFPNLKVVLAEGGIGWIPWLVERLDHMWGLHRHYTGVNTTVPPSELFHKHMFGCFVDDPVGITLRHQIGIDNILWECDYPHSDSFWPHARERLTEQLAEVPDNEVHAIVENNARRLFNFFE